MSDMLNEKFEEFASEQKDVLKEYQDPMPTVTATVIPGTGSDCLLYTSPSPRD